MALNQSLVSNIPNASAADNQTISCLGGKAGELIVADMHGKDYTSAYRGRRAFCTTFARATSLAATSQVGLIVYNPLSSGVNLALGKWSLDVIASSSTTTGFALGYTWQSTAPTGLTAADATGLSLLPNSATAFNTAQGKGYALATLLAAPLPFHLLAHNTAAIATTGEDIISGDLEGAYLVPPGGIVAVCALGAAAAASSVNATLMWAEIPV